MAVALTCVAWESEAMDFVRRAPTARVHERKATLDCRMVLPPGETGVFCVRGCVELFDWYGGSTTQAMNVPVG